MTHQELLLLLKNPEQVRPENIVDLKELQEQYPYFVPARMLYLKALQKSGDIHFESILSQVAIYSNDRKWLYYFIYPQDERPVNGERRLRAKERSGGYFDMLEAVETEGEDVNLSLKQLALRLKEARLQLLPTEPVKRKNTVENQESNERDKAIGETELPQKYTLDNYADKVKQLLQEKEYVKALDILKELNLNNPKKSIYFADQIRFIEKIIANTKK